MSKLIPMSTTLYETENVVKFLKRKLNVDAKEPAQISELLNSAGVALSLQRRLGEFLNENMSMQIYSGRLRMNLNNLNSFISKMGEKYSKDEEANLSARQKDFIKEEITAIDNAILNMAGRIYYSLVEINGLTSLSSDIRDFLDIAAKYHTEAEEASLEMYNKKTAIAESKGLEIEDIQDIEDDEDDFILGGSTTTAPKKIISEDIDK